MKRTYDAAGNKLQELISTEEETKTTDYIANFVYRNDTLQYMLTGQGRTTISPADNSSNEEFFVKDHLGNIRSIIDAKEYAITQYLASYELASANLETLLFDKVAEIREDKPGGTEGDKAGRLNAGDSARITGTSLLLKVMAGDQVNLQVFNYYEGYDSAADRPLSPGALLQSIVTTLTGGAGGLDDGESHDPDIVPKLFSVANYSRFDNIVEGITDSSRPRAYLNYVLFDRRMKLVGEGSGSFQVNGDGQWGVIGTNGTAIAIPENGYFGVFIVNGSKKDVWFDQLVVEVRREQLKEENHYYPHGLPMGHIGSVAAGETENRRKYQSNEYITDAGLNWMDFNFRQYDPQLGRFNSVDPLAGSTDMVSPYAAMGNAPESLTDPTGLRAGPPLKITKPGVGYGLIDNSMDKGYAFMLQMNADLVRMGMDPLGDFGGGSGGGGGGGGGFMSMQDAVMQIEQKAVLWGNVFNGRYGDVYDGNGRYKRNVYTSNDAPKPSYTYTSKTAVEYSAEGNLGLTLVVVGGKRYSDDYITSLYEWMSESGQQSNWGMDFLSSAWSTVNGMLENAASSVTQTVTGVVMPLINRTSIIWNEGFHSGSAWHSESKISWAVPYKVENWQFVREDQMMGQTLSWEDGKDVMKSTTNTLLLFTPIKHNIPIPGASPWLQKGVNWGAGAGTKQAFKQGFFYWLDN